jgi:hypothetical protein
MANQVGFPPNPRYDIYMSILGGKKLGPGFVAKTRERQRDIIWMGGLPRLYQ